MNHTYDYRVGLLGMSVLCFAAGIATALAMLVTTTPPVTARELHDHERREALKLVAEVYGAHFLSLRK